jgi:hypothetical protein
MSFMRNSIFAAIVTLGAVACSAAPSANDERATNATSQDIVIDAQTVARLPAGDSIAVDLGKPDATYTFDYAQAPIDFTRIDLVFASGDSVKMSDWLASASAGGHDLLADRSRFVLRPSASTAPPAGPSGDGAPSVSSDGCVTFCIWVCSSKEGPCTYQCWTSCANTTGHVINGGAGGSR